MSVNFIRKFNEELKEVKKTKEEFKNGPWKMKFHENLHSLLKQVLFTKDRVVQRQFSREVYDWALS